MFKDVMLDLETMSLAPNAAIVSIGAVRFDLETSLLAPDPFYCVVSLRSSVDAGLHVDPDTVMWWLGQDAAARRALDGPTVALPHALASFADWFKGDDGDGTDVMLWGNGANFDNVVLRSAYKACGLMPPWIYRNDRCYRTAMALAKTAPTFSFGGTKHNALDDATYQAMAIMSVGL